MRYYWIAATATFLVPAILLADTMRTRAWCANPAHGKSLRGAYGWISETFVSNTSDDCARFAQGHKQDGHMKVGCSTVGYDGEIKGY